MKFLPIAIQIMSVGIFAAAMPAREAQPSDNVGYCGLIYLKKTQLHAECDATSNTGEPVIVKTHIDLNKCVANVGGSMVGVFEGNFGKTCSKFKISRQKAAGPVTLSATCGGPHGKVDASTTLDFITTYRGRLICFGFGGDASIELY